MQSTNTASKVKAISQEIAGWEREQTTWSDICGLVTLHGQIMPHREATQAAMEAYSLQECDSERSK